MLIQISLLTAFAVEGEKSIDYFPTGMKWKEVLATPGIPLDTVTATLYEIGGDTLIGTMKYKSVFRNNKQCKLWIREEGQIVWLLTGEYPTEIKLYDFDWDRKENAVEVLREYGENFELCSISINTDDRNTTCTDTFSYEYISRHDGTLIRGIGRVSELNRDACLLGYKLPEVVIPGLEYHKILWIFRDGKTVFRSDDSNEWIDSIPKASESNQFIKQCAGFMLYENGKYSYYTLYGECTIDGVDYIKEGEGRYAYRQDGDKVYCYSFAGGKEYLVMDFGLEVGDIFTLYEGFDVVVEQKSDTLLACWNAQMTCKKLQLRGVEQPDFTDTWIEGIGSLRYGINPPKPKNTYLLHSSLYMEECKDYCDYCTFVFDPQEENLYATIVTLGEEIYEDAFSDYNEYMEVFYENKLLTLDLRDDTLYIGGYIGTYCERSLYFLIDEGVGTIYITSVPFPLGPEADCRSVNAIDVRIPGFTQKEYTIYCMGKEVVVRQPDDSYLVTEGKQWAVCRYSYSGGFRTETYHLQGDTIINGKTYKIEHASRNEDLSDMKPSGRYMREEDGRVYSITNKDQRDDFVFDYSMEIGDTLFYNPHTDYYGNVYKHPVCLRLIAIRDTIMPNGDGRVRKCYDTEEGCLNGDDVYEFHPVFHSFIEDIGYTVTGLSSSEIGTTGVGYSLLYVKQGDTMLYQQEDGVLWKDNTNIEDIKANSPDTPYYDLQGRPVAHPTRGIYIKDGKKVAIK